jgi:hypothetical protein
LNPELKISAAKINVQVFNYINEMPEAYKITLEA